MALSHSCIVVSPATFADHCTATQMVQAVSFPLAVTLREQRRGWVSGPWQNTLARSGTLGHSNCLG